MNSRKKNNILRLLFIWIAFFCFAYLINQNIFHYEDIHNVRRTFSNNEDKKGNYFILQDQILKKAVYCFSISYINENENNSWQLIADDDLVKSESFPVGSGKLAINLNVEKPTEKVSLLVHYNQDPGKFRIEELYIDSDHVIYKESILRHITETLLLLVFFVILTICLVFRKWQEKVFEKLLKPSSISIIIFLIVISILVSYPELQSGYVRADDSIFHISRIEGIKNDLENDVFPPRISLFFLNNYGYATGLFYPDLFLWPFAVLRILGFDFVTVYKILVIFTNLLTAFVMYFVSKKMTSSRYAGICGTIFYEFASYRLIDVYNRGAAGEYLAMIFLPVVILGVYELFENDSHEWIWLAVGMSCLLMTHTITPFITAAVLFVFIILNIRRIFQQKKILSGLLKAVLVTLGLTAWFIFPMVEQILSGDIMMTNTQISLFQDGLPLKSLLVNYSKWEPPVKPFIGWGELFILLLFVPVAKRKKIPNTAIWLLIFSFLTAWISTRYFPWQFFVQLHKIIQFPWRFLSLTAPMLAVLGAILAEKVIPIQGKKYFLVIVFSFCFICAYPILKDAAENRVMDDSGYKLENNRIGNGEFLPIGADKEFIDKNKDHVICSVENCSVSNEKREKLSFTADIQTKSDKTDLEFPLLFYTGYSASLTKDDGTTIILPVKRGIHGLTSVNVEEVGQVQIKIWYKGTLIQKISSCISLFMVAVLLVAILFQKKYKRYD